MPQLLYHLAIMSYLCVYVLRLLCAFGGRALFNFRSPVPRVAAGTPKVLKKYKVSNGLVDDHLGLADGSGESVRRAMVARWMVPTVAQRQS